jgi:hypothetical protein
MWALAAEGEGWCLASGSERKDPPAGLVGVPIEGFSIPWGVTLLTESTRQVLQHSPLLIYFVRRGRPSGIHDRSSNQIRRIFRIDWYWRKECERPSARDFL